MSANDSAFPFFVLHFPFYKITFQNTTEKYKMVWRITHFPGNAVLRGMPVKKRKSEHLELEVPAQQKITVEGRAICQSLLFLPPPDHPQHIQQTHKLKYNSSFSRPLSHFFFSFAVTLFHPLCLHPFCPCGSAQGRATKPLCSTRSVFWRPTTSTKCCHGDVLSTLPVALIAALLCTRRSSQDLLFFFHTR